MLIGDHRLNVEIVALPIDHTLQQSRWEVLDARLVFKALNSYAPVVQGGNSSGTGVSEMSRVIAKGLENRRHMILRSLEKQVFKAIIDRNAGVPDFDEMPSLRFTPKPISLDFSADIIGQILMLRDRGDILHSSSQSPELSIRLTVQRSAANVQKRVTGSGDCPACRCAHRAGMHHRRRSSGRGSGECLGCGRVCAEGVPSRVRRGANGNGQGNEEREECWVIQ